MLWIIACEHQHIHYCDKAYFLKQVRDQKLYHNVFFPFACRKSEGCFTKAVEFESCVSSFLHTVLSHEHGEELEQYELCVFNKEFYNMV